MKILYLKNIFKKNLKSVKKIKKAAEVAEKLQ